MSTMIVTLEDFKTLAEVRIVEAKCLLDAAQWSGSYYLAGYSVELALKACIMGVLRSIDEFPSKKFSDQCYTHSLETLVSLARITAHRETAITSNPTLETNWSLVKDWSEQKRYHTITETEAKELYEAIADNTNGVFPWIKTFW